MGTNGFLGADEGASEGSDSDLVSGGLVLMSLSCGFDAGALTGFGAVCMELVVMSCHSGELL